MARCARCWVRGSMRAMNVIVNICGVGMIIYSLWLQKMWDDGVALLPSVANLPLPWFIFTCLGIGIAVCFSTLFGHVVANCIGNSSLCIYIITLLSLLFLEATVLVLIFFKMDWAKLISEYIDEHNEQFKVFVVFHLKMCRLIVILILLLQIIVIVFAVILWAVGTGPTTDQTPDVSNLRQSFLVWPSAPALIENSQTCTRCGELQSRNLLQSYASRLKRAIMTRLNRTSMNDN
ncbi:tetraspanin-19-like isoform X1 [Eucalyptus grandis]|uniref:tetraspanin-19-like isoform X1 n=1 Tax=Eucalyptus grandis TaxID=71139 RepID=UPI00192EEFAD|nr:tetraspanin-19-like isoform X1 [Eucalyptus grandis]